MIKKNELFFLILSILFNIPWLIIVFIPGLLDDSAKYYFELSLLFFLLLLFPAVIIFISNRELKTQTNENLIAKLKKKLQVAQNIALIYTMFITLVSYLFVTSALLFETIFFKGHLID